MTAQSERKRSAQNRISPERLERLVASVKDGDVEAFRQIYDFYGGKIVQYIYRMTGSRPEAEDLTQDTFVQAYRKIGSLKDNRKFQSWLYRIAQNNVYQKYRGKQPHFESINDEEGQELADFQKLATPMKSPEAGVLSGELQEVIQKAIAELPEKYRKVFVLSALHRLSYQEISEIADRSLAAVKSDIHRARVTVRDKIKDYLGENYGMSNLF